MTTLKHPRIPDVSVDVPEGDVTAWADQGWVADASEVDAWGPGMTPEVTETHTPIGRVSRVEPSAPKRRRK